MLKNKKADGLIDLLATPERLNFMFFPDEPLSKSADVIFHLADRPVKINSLEDLKHYRVETQLGYDYPNGLLKFLVNREKVETLEQNLNKLVLKRIDIIVENCIVGRFAVKTMGFSHKVATTGLPGEFINRYHIGFAQKKGYRRLAENSAMH